MDKENARKILDAAFEGSQVFDRSVFYAKAGMAEPDFLAYRRKVAEFLGDILIDVINPLLNEHPDLKPEGWDDPYVPTTKQDNA